jgi:hypothetical protein
MNKKFFLFAMLAAVTASAQRTVPVSITNTKVDYSQKNITFNLSWQGSDASHRNEVWVFVDIQPITGANTLGVWSPATLVPTATTVTAGSGNQYSSLTHTAVSGNTRGLWVKGTSANTTRTFAATVKVTLANGTPAKFNACAYATDYPPNAVSYSGGSYTFKGTKPFIINGTSVNDNKYAVTTISSLTDATGCPGGVGRDEVLNNGVCAPGLTAVGSYCRDLAADNAMTFTGCGIEIIAGAANLVTWSLNAGCPAGWRWPTSTEARCIYTNRLKLPDMTEIGFYVNGEAECLCNYAGPIMPLCDNVQKSFMFLRTTGNDCLATGCGTNATSRIASLCNDPSYVRCVR